MTPIRVPAESLDNLISVKGVSMARTDIWMQLGVRIFEKFEIIHISQQAQHINQWCVGALIRLWSISLTDFPEGKGVYQVEHCLSLWIIFQSL